MLLVKVISKGIKEMVKSFMDTQCIPGLEYSWALGNWEKKGRKAKRD